MSECLYTCKLSNRSFGGFHRTLQRVRLANRGRLLLRTPGPVPFVLMLRPFFPELVMSTDLLSRTSLGTSILLPLIGIFRINIYRHNLASIPKIINYWLYGTNCQAFLLRFSYNSIIVLSWRHYFTTHDVIDNVARLVFLLYASFRNLFLYKIQVYTKWSKSSYTGQITIFRLTAATSSKIVHNF